MTLDEVRDYFKGKRVCVMGSAPSCLDNVGSDIDGYDSVVRVNNFKIVGFEDKVGTKCDVHYSFYGNSIRVNFDYLKLLGVKLHMCKCPNGEPYAGIYDYAWHRKHAKGDYGYNFEYIYKLRNGKWIAPVYIPDISHYLQLFNFLGCASPTTGFAAIWELIQCELKELYITGFDFFTSKMHNVNEHWRAGKPDDPLRHEPEREREHVRQWSQLPHVRIDNRLKELFNGPT